MSIYSFYKIGIIQRTTCPELQFKTGSEDPDAILRPISFLKLVSSPSILNSRGGGGRARLDRTLYFLLRNIVSTAPLSGFWVSEGYI